MSSQGEIEKVQYGDYGIEGLRVDMEYEEDEIQVYAFENRFLNAKGSIDIVNQNTNLEIELKDFDNTKVNVSIRSFL